MCLVRRQRREKTVPKHKSLSYQLVCLIALILKTFTVSILTGTVVVCVLACDTVLLSLGLYCHLRKKSRQKPSTGNFLVILCMNGSKYRAIFAYITVIQPWITVDGTIAGACNSTYHVVNKCIQWNLCNGHY